MRTPRFSPAQLCKMMNLTREQIRDGHLRNAADSRKRAQKCLDAGKKVAGKDAVQWLDDANESECLADWIMHA